MKEIVNWLINLENDVATLYAEAAELFKLDKEFSYFLYSHAEDEKLHVNVLKKILNFLEEKGDLPSDYTLSEKTKVEVERILDGCKKKMRSNSLTKTEMLETVTRAELSEFNPFLIYTVELIKGFNNHYISDVIDIQAHLNDLKKILEMQEGNEKIQHLLKEFPKVWRERILIVEDCSAIRKLFMNMFANDELIECSPDAGEAIEMIRCNHYSVIITEVNLSSMSGIDLYKRVVETDPDNKKKFLFITSDDSLENISFFKENGLPYLIKPAYIKDVRKIVASMLAQRNATKSKGTVVDAQ